MDDAEVKKTFREWVDEGRCPWCVSEQYYTENNRRLRSVRDAGGSGVEQQSSAAGRKATASNPGGETKASATGQENPPSATGHEGEAPEEEWGEEAGDEDRRWYSDTEDDEEHAEKEEDPEVEEATRVLKLLYKGNVAEVNRREEQERKAKVYNRKHDFYRKTRCTNVAQEEQSAVPGGVLNEHEDSSDDEEFFGEQKEIAKEIQGLRAAQQWVNQEGWDAAEEGQARSEKSGAVVDLRLDWEAVKKKLDKGSALDLDATPKGLSRDAVLQDYSLDTLDPTQRAFADRVLAWGSEVVRTYRKIAVAGRPSPVPQLRSWLGGSAGSGKSRTLKTCVHHLRLFFQREQVDASVELTAYTGVAAFNMGFGAKTASSSFRVFPNAAWKNELEGEAFRKLEQQWAHVVLLIVDEISFIGKAFFARMHFRLQQAKRRFFNEAGLDPNNHTFGGLSLILVGDFGQLEPIDDWSMCDTESTFHDCP